MENSERYGLLSAGDDLRAGDEFYGADLSWHPFSEVIVGEKVQHHSRPIRRISTPILQAAAMRARAAEYMHAKHRGGMPKHIMSEDGLAILALPLEADHAALLAEAKRLPEVLALIELLPFLATADQASRPQLIGLCKDLAKLISALETQ